MSLLLRLLKIAGWAPLLVFIAHVVCILTGAYEAWPPLDIPFHLVGGVVIAFFFHRSLSLLWRERHLDLGRPFTQQLLVFTLTVTAATFWEFAEYLADHFLGTTSQQGGLEDTLLDLLLGTLGGTLLLLLTRGTQHPDNDAAA